MKHIAYEIHEQLHISRMYSFFTARHKELYTFTGESHNFWETMYVISGSICAAGNDRVYNLEAGDMIFHEPLELHKYYTKEPNTKFMVFAYDLEGELADFFRQKVFNLNKEQKNILSSMLEYANTRVGGSSPAYTIPEHYVQEDRFLYFNPLKDNYAYGHGLVLYIYQLMLSLAYNGHSAAPSSSQDVVLFSNAVKFMTDNIAQELSVSDVAKRVNISISGLKRIFDRCAGMGIHKYFLMLKLNEATKLLESGLAVSDVAYRLGFANPSYFSRAYKRELKHSPSDVKQKKQGTF